MEKENINLTNSLQELNEIVEWFEGQEDVDVELGLEKARKAATLIKNSKDGLAQIENEFREIEKEITGDESKEAVTLESEPPVDGIPF